MSLPQLVIAAGGLGTRLGADYSDTPKVLAPVKERPFLLLQLEKFQQEGVRKIHFLLGHKSEMVIEILEQLDSPLKISYSIDPPGLLGTGGSLLNAINYLEEEFLFTYGDSYLLANLDEIYSEIQSLNYSNVMCITNELDDENRPNTLCAGNRVLFYSKDINAEHLTALDYGLLKFNREFLEGFKQVSDNFDLAEILNYLIDLKELYSFQVNDSYFDIGSQARLRRFERFLDENAR